ncbi:MAG: holo-ACP synthase [Clostridiales bacterium]|nr:MAG: holo-ACP synthase [Clostridiales bacterium]
MSIGVDILKISRLEKLASKTEFLNKLFSQKEIEYFKSRSYNINTVAGAFCAKEALAKAIGCGLSRLPLTEISVVRDELGKPFFEFSEKAKEILKTYSDKNFALTISHDNDMAAAVVFADFDENHTRFVSAVQKSDVENGNIISLAKAVKLLPKRAGKFAQGHVRQSVCCCRKHGFYGCGASCVRGNFKNRGAVL